MLVTTRAKLDGVHWPVETLCIHGNYIKSYFFFKSLQMSHTRRIASNPSVVIFTSPAVSGCQIFHSHPVNYS